MERDRLLGPILSFVAGIHNKRVTSFTLFQYEGTNDPAKNMSARFLSRGKQVGKVVFGTVACLLGACYA